MDPLSDGFFLCVHRTWLSFQFTFFIHFFLYSFIHSFVCLFSSTNLKSVVVMIRHHHTSLWVNCHAPRLTGLVTCLGLLITRRKLEHHWSNLVTINPRGHLEIKRIALDGLTPDVDRDLVVSFGIWGEGGGVGAIFVVFYCRCQRGALGRVKLHGDWVTSCDENNQQID